MNQTIDKSNELQASVTLLNDRLHFNGIVENNQPVSIDYTPPLGDNLGYTSLELLLLSLGSCMGSSILTLLRRMRKDIHGLTMNIRGIRRNEHPTGFKTIFIEIYITTSNATDADIAQVLKMSEDKYCPVWAMVKGNVEVNVKSTILTKNSTPEVQSHLEPDIVL
ncbi:MAG TPA: OsmC family protein [Chitinispirillaceae bacterium]|nr:OsmC family protein [Chitinispirillaceae bacterium]